MNPLKLTFSLLFLTGTALMAEPAPAIAPTPADAAATTSDKPVDVLAEALPILQAKYSGFADLHLKTGDQLNDLVTRSDGGIRLLDQPAKPTSIITALLPGNIGYWRLASFTPEKSWDELGAQLGQWNTPDFQGMVLDLRSNVATDDFSDYTGAMQVAAFFARDATIPFSMGGSNTTTPVISFHPAHPFHGPMVVLINHQTSSAAEALAGYLKTQGALIIGQPTGARGGVYDEKVLSTGQVLLYQVMTVSLADGTQLGNHPVTPDIEMPVDPSSEKGALILIKDKQVLDVIGEAPERHLMSEAALIKGIDPEWDTYLASLEKKPVLLSLPVVRDDVLVAAIDSLKAIRVTQKKPEPPLQIVIPPPSNTSVQ
jgi:hypothetical protein